MTESRRSSIRGAFLFVLLLLVSAGTVGCAGFPSGSTSDPAGGDCLHTVLERGSLRVGMSGTQPPLNMKNQRGALMGLDVELAQALADAMRVELVVVETPFAQLLSELEAGKVDLVISSLTITPSRNARVAFAGPYFISGATLLTRADLVDALGAPESFNDPARTWAALGGSTGEELIRETFPLAGYEVVEDQEEAVRRIAEGELDGLVADLPFVQFQIARNPDLGLGMLPTPFTTEPLGVALPPNSPLFANLVQNYLNTLDYTGELMQMKMHWMSAGDWLSEMP